MKLASSTISAAGETREQAPKRIGQERQFALRSDELSAVVKSAWFSTLSFEVQRALIRLSSVERVPANTVLTAQFVAPNVWLGIAKGSVLLSHFSSSKRETAIELFEPGQWFGEGILLSASGAPYEARTWSPTTLLAMSSTILQSLLSRYPELVRALHLLQCQHSNRMIERMIALAQPGLEQRVISVLHQLTMRFGTPVRDAIRIDLALTQSQLGVLVGCSRQRINSVMQDLQRLGKVRHANQFIECIDLRTANNPEATQTPARVNSEQVQIPR